MTDPFARLMGEDLSESCERRALALVQEQMMRQDVRPNENERLWMEIGIGAGSAATMQELVERGVISSERTI
jgi:hypothetical protein